ncbi:unnamed protein product [Nyctereutes procyonoides]|uniref:(raccoon dog) hypothetical protein n=1 Tax=Nyctereutes procyonoides TaxID=34880 RepID=A0A811YS05_NYCPR|nr:unnamed protein product [Nyctereutes procyonoides]CAD7688160.1 unnamed protein product [Nyctereutes procyonoides]
METSNNPWKFSEVIALHNQKQAEEKAAFKELQKSQYLQLGPSRGQLGVAPRTSRHPGLVDRIYRERSRLGSPHGRPMTNSDSALHQSTMTPTQPEPFTGGSQDAHQKRVLLVTVPGMEETTSETDKNLSKQAWGTEKTGSGPKSCEVPGINIFPSADQENTTALIPATHNTGGPLPDLTTIYFPSPLPTPLDPEEPTFPALSSSSSTGNLAANLTHLGIGGASQGMSTAGSSPLHRPAGVSPLSPSTEVRRQQAQQVSPTLSQLASLMWGPQLPPVAVTVPSSVPQAPPESPGQPPTGIDITSRPALQQHRATARSPANLSPTSPVSTVQHDGQCRQLQQPVQPGLHTQLLAGGLGSLPDTQQLGYPSHSSIPNIILTVTGESPPSLSKGLTSTLARVGDGSFDSDHQLPLDELKIEPPLTLDGLHMLNDPDTVLAGPATEDTFRMGRL